MYSDDDYRYDEDEFAEDRIPKAQPLQEYAVNDDGCRIERYSPFVISIYDTFEKGVDEIIEFIRTHLNDYCKKGISPSYFSPERVLRDNDFLITLSYTADRDYEESELIVGFAVVSNTRERTNGDDNSLYIDVICSNNELHRTRFAGGKVILNSIVEYARNNDYDSVSLKALSNVINYYRQFGFRFIKNGETEEQPYIHELAEANKSIKIPSVGHANQMLLIERAIMFSREVDEEGKPVLNHMLFRQNLQDQLSLSHLPTEEEALNYLGMISPFARDDGHGGLHDLYFSLIKSGYADLHGCPNITRRQFVRPEEIRSGVWKLWMTCEEGGFQMRKIVNNMMTSDAIVPCDTYNGGSKKKRMIRHIKRKQTSKISNKNKQGMTIRRKL